MKRAFFEISPEFLIEALHLPADTQIYGATWGYYSNAVRLWIMHPDFPDRPEGAQPIEVMPTFHTADDGTVTFEGWGIGDSGRTPGLRPQAE